MFMSYVVRSSWALLSIATLVSVDSTCPKDPPNDNVTVVDDTFKQLDVVADNQVVEQTGNLIIKGDVGAHAHILVQDGELIIEGNVGPNCEIRNRASIIIAPYEAGLKSKDKNAVIIAPNASVSKGIEITYGNGKQCPLIIDPKASIKGDIYINGKKIPVDAQNKPIIPKCGITIKGSLSDNIQLFADTGSIMIQGKMGNHCVVQIAYHGNISAADTGENCSLQTEEGNLKAGYVGDDSNLTADKGTVDYIGKGKNVTIVSKQLNDSALESKKSANQKNGR